MTREQLLEAVEAERYMPVPPPPLKTPLTFRERQVLRRLADGKTREQIAKELFLGVGTVKTYTANAYEKLGARNAAHAVFLGWQHGLIREDHR